MGKAADVVFKTTGKIILKKGWRVVFEDPNAKEKETDLLPLFTIGESGAHEPSFLEKETKAPNQFTEATLLRAMETAGKQVEDDDLRELMKENGIGRPSTRANIIETLFKRQYIIRNKKQVLPTATGIQLIDTIQNDMVKSAELTGSWEKQLRDIEKGTYSAASFINNMKQMVGALVDEVRLETRRAIHAIPLQEEKKIAKPVKKSPAGIAQQKCPKCKQGSLLKGKTAYGCSAYQSGCTFLLPYVYAEKKISENQYLRLLQKGSTVNLKDFKTQSGTVEGLLRFDENFQLILEQKKTLTKAVPDELSCPKCKKGTVLKGKLAYGCSQYKVGCTFNVSFVKVREQLNGVAATKDLVHQILKSNS
jgi:DNA topoisomerase-3